MYKFILLLLTLSIPAFAEAATTNTYGPAVMNIEWEAPTLNVDGTPLVDLAAFIVYWKFGLTDAYVDSESKQINDPVSIGDSVNIVVPGAVGDTVTVYIVAKAMNANNQLSANSNEITRSFLIINGSIPMPPTNLRETIGVTFEADSSDKTLVAVR